MANKVSQELYERYRVDMVELSVCGVDNAPNHRDSLGVVIP
jgi:hypothetical protein